MSPRAASWTAGLVLALTLPLYLVSTWLGWTRPPLTGIEPFTSVDLVWIASFVAFELVGAVIVVKRPHHPVGWLFLAAGAVSVVTVATYEYAVLALLLGAALPAGELASWVSAWTWSPGLALIVVALILFPTGRPPSRRWWPLVWVAIAIPTVIAVAHALDLWSVRGPALLRDPEALYGGLPPDLWSLRLMGVAFPVFLACAVLAMTGLIVRYRRAREVERRQLKVLALVAVVGAPAIVASELLAPSGIAGTVAEILSAPVWFPVAAGVAILRYRLYEIDRVLSRTVSYVVLTLLLVGIYVAGVLGLGAFIRAVTGGSGGDLVVAASTLAVAAAFGPLRRRIQAVVDRRFDRSRYDAMRTVGAFASRLRDEVDLDSLQADLVRVSSGAVRPAHVSVWMPDTGGVS